MTARFIIRPATIDDVDRIARAHTRSIRTLGATAYDATVISAWGRARSGEPYASAMERGEHFFVALEGAPTSTPGGTNGASEAKPRDDVVGFSSYRVEDGKHRTAIYVVGEVARQGVGTALFREAL